MINKEHIKYSSLSEEALATITGLHEIRNQIIELAKESEAIAIKLYPLWETNEFTLQAVWEFPINKKFHKGWEYPFCKCPKMDNEDAYSYQRYISEDCLIHGQ